MICPLGFEIDQNNDLQYKKLTLTLDVMKWDKSSIPEYFRHKYKNKENPTVINPKASLMLRTQRQLDASINDISVERIAKLIYWVCIRRNSLHSASSLCQIPTFQARKILQYFWKKINQIEDLQGQLRVKSRRKVSKEHIDCVKDYLEAHRGKIITIKQIQSHLRESWPQLPQVSVSTVRRVVKTQLGYNFKRMNSAPPISMKPDNISKYFKAAITQEHLESKGYEIVYIDECSMGNRNKNLYGWAPVGHRGYVTEFSRSLSFHLMIAISKDRFYGVMGSHAYPNSNMFRKFIQELVTARDSDFRINNRRMILVCDNVAYHTSKKLQNYFNETEIRLLTIWPYSPSLDPVEKVILALRKKIEVLTREGK